jgi:hypothetical protein
VSLNAAQRVRASSPLSPRLLFLARRGGGAESQRGII